MPKPRKSVARQARNDRRQTRRNHDGLHQMAANDFDVKPKIKARTEPVVPLNNAQKRYDGAIKSADVTFGIGPAGTGKTWFAAMRAGEAYDNGLIDKIIVTRPAVEAGENLGFLPGELEEKYDPYFRPVREALVQHFGEGKFEYMVKAGIIEARPLALLRGSSIDRAWIIADEMQNATRTQFKMLLTRGGKGTKFIVNGDPKQTDLPAGQSGLADAVQRLANKPGIRAVRFTADDIVRSGLTQIVVQAYEDSKGEDIDFDFDPRAGLEKTLAA